MPVSHSDISSLQRETTNIPPTPRSLQSSRRVLLVAFTLVLSFLFSVLQSSAIGVSAAPTFSGFIKPEALEALGIEGSEQHAKKIYVLYDITSGFSRERSLRKRGDKAEGQSTEGLETKETITTTHQKTGSETISDTSQQNSITEIPTASTTKLKDSETPTIHSSTELISRETQTGTSFTPTEQVERATETPVSQPTEVRDSTTPGLETTAHEPATQSTDFRVDTDKEEPTTSNTAPPTTQDQTGTTATPISSLAIPPPEETLTKTSTPTTENPTPPETPSPEGPEVSQTEGQRKSDSKSSASMLKTPEATAPSTVATPPIPTVETPTQESLLGDPPTQTSLIEESPAPNPPISSTPTQSTPVNVPRLSEDFGSTVSAIPTSTAILVPGVIVENIPDVVKETATPILTIGGDTLPVAPSTPLLDLTSGTPTTVSSESEAIETRALATSPVLAEETPSSILEDDQVVQTPTTSENTDQGRGQPTTPPTIGSTTEVQENEQSKTSAGNNQNFESVTGVDTDNNTTIPPATAPEDTSTQSLPAATGASSIETPTTIERITPSEVQTPVPSTSILSSQPQNTGSPTSTSTAAALESESIGTVPGPESTTLTSLNSESTTITTESPIISSPVTSNIEKDVPTPITTDPGPIPSSALELVVPTITSAGNTTSAITTLPTSSNTTTPTDSITTPESATTLSSVTQTTGPSPSVETSSEAPVLTSSVLEATIPTGASESVESALRSSVRLESLTDELPSTGPTAAPTTLITIASSTTKPSTADQASSTTPSKTTIETTPPGTSPGPPQTTGVELSPVAPIDTPPDVVVPITRASDIPPFAEVTAGTAVDEEGNKVEILAFYDSKSGETFGSDRATIFQSGSMSLSTPSFSFIIVVTVALVGSLFLL